MLLSDMLQGVELSAPPLDPSLARRDAVGIAAASQEELRDRLFVCLKGRQADGHSFAAQAEAAGAAAVLCQQDVGCRRQILTPDTRSAYARICANFYGNPARELSLAAVTGTNGKTSVATTVRRLLTAAGVRAGLFSTIQWAFPLRDGSLRQGELPRTTPDPRDLHRLLREMADEELRAAVMEASSQALDQGRLIGLRFAVGVFTNLTQDHLDYHGTMEAYYHAKESLFDQCASGVINLDDPYGARLAKRLSIPMLGCSTRDPRADLFAEEIRCGEEGVRFTLCHGGGRYPVSFGIPGIYSVQNALSAIGACLKLGLSLERILAELPELGPIRGRNEVIPTGLGFRVICDYAHTPDGLENLLRSTREYVKGRIILLFGCGGDRDRGKRPQMGEIASRYADFLVLTSDNPRTENPGAIIGDIMKGVTARSCIAIVERREAIRYALSIARRGDTVILAGKGHERYQVLGRKTLYFDERRLVEGILRSMGGGADS